MPAVDDCLNRFAASGLIWPSALTDTELQRRLFPPPPAVPSDQRPTPDWAKVHAELRRPGVTLALLWQEYRLSQPAATSHGFVYRQVGQTGAARAGALAWWALSYRAVAAGLARHFQENAGADAARHGSARVGRASRSDS